MKVSTLKNLARERGLRQYSRLRKSELIELIKNPLPPEYTKTQLRQMARERGLRRYSRLRKYQLLKKLVGNEKQILDRENDAGMANVPFLTPTPYIPPQATPSSSNDVKDLIDYLNKKTRRPKNVSYRSVPELNRLLKLKKLLKEIDEINKRIKIFEVKETDSALKKFAKVYTMDGKVGFDPQRRRARKYGKSTTR